MILHHRVIIMTKGISPNGFKCLIDVILEIMNVHMTVCGEVHIRRRHSVCV